MQNRARPNAGGGKDDEQPFRVLNAPRIGRGRGCGAIPSRRKFSGVGIVKKMSVRALVASSVGGYARGGAWGSAPRSASAFAAVPLCTNEQKPLSSCRLLSSRSRAPHRITEAGRWMQYGLPTRSGVAFFATDGTGEDAGEKPKRKPKNKKGKEKVKINPNWKEEADVDALASAFDEIARKEGFDPSTSVFADGATFEDDFSYDEFGDSDDDGFLDFGRDDDAPGGKEQQSMAERIAAAQRDMDVGTVTVSSELDSFAKDVTQADLSRLGFRRETNPFGDDETLRKEDFKIITNAMVCSACGADFQSKNEQRPGYLPPEKHEIQVKLGKIEQLQKLQEKAEAFEWSPEDEIEWLIQSEGGTTEGPSESAPGMDPVDSCIDVQKMADEMGLDLVELSKKKVICKRCHGLQNFGEVDESLRPGWTDEPLLSQEAFRELLLPIREKVAVIIALVDIFDFSGSVLPELDAIAGDNPVILAANKADLLPTKVGQTRAENWVRRELEYLGVQSIANIGGAIRLVSCKTGFGMSALLGKARSLADDMDCDVYVVGAANAGKSTLINYILDKNEKKTAAYRFGKKKRAGNANAKKGEVTASPLPGTTLKFIKVDLGNGRSLYDTPGLLVPGTLTQMLTPAELKMVVPKKEVEPITFRIASGKCVLIGGLAKIEVIGDSKPFLFTFFVSNDIKLHATDTERADDFIAKHAGGLLTPPLEPGPERMAQIGEFESHTIDIDGVGWKEAGADIALRGLGWVAVTGAGVAKVKVSVPQDIGVSVRPPLMPFDIWEVAAKYTGGRAVRKSGKSKSGKRRKGVGRR